MASAKDDQQASEEVRKFAARLVYAMDVRGIGSNELERMVGMLSKSGKPTGHVTKMRKAERGLPGWALATAIAAALRVRVAWLLGGEEPMSDVGERGQSTASGQTGDHATGAVSPSTKKEQERSSPSLNSSQKPNKSTRLRTAPHATTSASGTVPTKLGKRVLNSLAKEEKKQTGR